MTTTIDHNKADVYSRPNARIDGDGQLEIRASAAGNCRRALWYEATGHEVTNPKTEETLTVLEAGNALEPVVLRAMERAGWEVTPADPRDPQQVSVQVGPNMLVTGHPDATGVLPLFGGEAVVEVKTRGPEAFKRWRTLGAERSHPASVAQAAFYTLGTFGELRDAVIATMDTGSRQWDYEVIPAERVGQALDRASEWLGQLGAHLVLYGPDPDALPERDYSVTDWQCKSCPFLNICLPGTAAEAEGEPEPAEDAEPVEPVTDEQARNALHEYEEIQDTLREFEDEKRWVVDKLRAWLGQQGVDKAKLQGREKTRSVGMVTSRRYSVDYRRLNNLLDPQVLGDRHRERLRVPAGQLDAPQRSARRGRFPFQGRPRFHSTGRGKASATPCRRNRNGTHHQQGRAFGQGRDGTGDEVCAASRGIGFPIQSGGIRREFLGQPTYLKAKAEGDNSMSVKRLRPESVVEPVPQDPRDTVKAGLLEPQFPDGELRTRR